jgi:hypothetical protein
VHTSAKFTFYFCYRLTWTADVARTHGNARPSRTLQVSYNLGAGHVAAVRVSLGHDLSDLSVSTQPGLLAPWAGVHRLLPNLFRREILRASSVSICHQCFYRQERLSTEFASSVSEPTSKSISQ